MGSIATRRMWCGNFGRAKDYDGAHLPDLAEFAGAEIKKAAKFGGLFVGSGSDYVPADDVTYCVAWLPCGTAAIQVAFPMTEYGEF
jgi:hypothetical protein